MSGGRRRATDHRAGSVPETRLPGVRWIGAHSHSQVEWNPCTPHQSTCPYPPSCITAAMQEAVEQGIESLVGRPLLYQAHASAADPSTAGRGETQAGRQPTCCA